MLQMPSQLCSNDPQSLMASVSPSIAIRNSNSFLNNNQSVFNANRPCQKPVCTVKPLCQSQPSQGNYLLREYIKFIFKWFSYFA